MEMEFRRQRNRIIECLQVILTRSRSRMSQPLKSLIGFAESDSGYITLIEGMIELVSFENATAPIVLGEILCHCPLPSTTSLSRVSRLLKDTIVNSDVETCEKAIIVLMILHQKYPQQNFYHDEIVDVLIDHLNHRNPRRVLLALVMIERYARTTYSRGPLIKKLDQLKLNPFLGFERYYESKDYNWRAVGFVAKWALDNVLLVENRPFTYEKTSMVGVNAIMKPLQGAMSYKVAASGLEIRSDSLFFEYVFSSYRTSNVSCYFYEAEIQSSGNVRVGWVNNTQPSSGVLPLGYFVYYDSSEGRVVSNHSKITTGLPKAKPGDIVGTYINCIQNEIHYYLNGAQIIGPVKIYGITRKQYRFYPSCSLASFQQCKINFGRTRFKHAPKRFFRNINKVARLLVANRAIIPQSVQIQKMSRVEKPSSLHHQCFICCDHKRSVPMIPCGHVGVCNSCLKRIKRCPFCSVVLA